MSTDNQWSKGDKMVCWRFEKSFFLELLEKTTEIVETAKTRSKALDNSSAIVDLTAF